MKQISVLSIFASLLLSGCHEVTPAWNDYHDSNLGSIEFRACGENSNIIQKVRTFCQSKIKSYMAHSCGGDIGSKCSVGYWHDCMVTNCKHVVATYETQRTRQVTQQRQRQSSQQAAEEPAIDEKDVFDAIMGLSTAIDGYDPEIHGLTQELFDLLSD